MDNLLFAHIQPTKYWYEEVNYSIPTALHAALQHEQQKRFDISMAAALKEGFVEVSMTLLTLHGAPGSGKSSITDLFLGKPPAQERHSTPLAKTPARVIAGSLIAANSSEKGASTVWRTVGAEELMEMLSESMKSFLEDRPAHNILTAKAELHSQQEEVYTSAQPLESLPPPSNPTPSISQDESVELGKSGTNVADSKSPVTACEPPDTALTDSDIGGSATAKLLLFLLSKASKSNRLNTRWVHMVDSGGQPQFQEVLPLFIRNNSINIVTFKLCDKLSDKPMFEFVWHGQHLCPPSNLRLTNEELIESLFRSLSSAKLVTIKHAKSGPGKPHFMIIGTFADQLECCEESLEQKNQRLLELLEQYEEVRIDSNPACEEIIFAINAIATEGREELAAWLQQVITSNKEATLVIDVPMRWFALELSLVQMAEEKDRYVLTMEECESAGKFLQVNTGDLKNALVFFSQLAIFLYIPEVLPNLVFIKTQPILDKVSGLFSLTFGDAKIIIKGHNLPAGAQRRLKREGFFTKAVLHSLPESFIKNIFTEEDFLKMLVHLLVAAPITDEEGDTEYFLPCVLPSEHLPDKEKKPYLKNSSAWVITWEMKPLPIGLFPALVVSLLSSRVGPKFSLPKKISQLRHAIRLYCADLGGALLLEDNHYWLEVCYSGQASFCPLIRSAVLIGISQAQKQLHYNLGPPQVGFSCTLCTSPSQPHPCLVNCHADPQHPLGCRSGKKCRICSAPSSHYQMTCTSDIAMNRPVKDPKLLAWLPALSEGQDTY